MIARHSRCEVAEKKKFLSYMVAQRRGRGHRTDSTTVDTDAVENGDDSNLPSAATVIAELNSYGRQRQPSCSVEPSRDEEDFNSTSIPPWPLRSFPMMQKDFDDMMRESEAAAAAAAFSKRRSSVVPATIANEEVVDEEWAVQGNTDKLVLKLTKR